MGKNNIYNLDEILENIKQDAQIENIRITQHGQQEMAEEDIMLSDQNG